MSVAEARAAGRGRGQAEPVEPPRREAPRLAASPSPLPAGLGDPARRHGRRDKAREILDEARQRSRGALAKASPFTEKVVRDGATLYRARFSGFEEADSAQEACKALKRNGFACFATRS